MRKSLSPLSFDVWILAHGVHETKNNKVGLMPMKTGIIDVWIHSIIINSFKTPAITAIWSNPIKKNHVQS